MIRKIGKYELLEELGHGGMATVYRAHDTVLRRMVAIKIMHPHLRGAAQARARFAREAQSVARIKHPHILEIYDYSGEDSEESYIVTELLTGPTLRKFSDEHPEIPAEVVAAFGINLAQALDAAHASGIIHRDVKPENVILHDNRLCKLTDFGIAQMLDAQGMTATGQVIGSPGHMPLEQVEGKECDARSDLFSLGTVLYALATGKPAFPGSNPHQILRRIMEGDYVDPLRLNPSLGGRMRSILIKLLEKDRERRYATAKDVEVELRSFLSEMKQDDPDALLARYLSDPAAFVESETPKTLARLIELGQAALAKKQRVVALDHFNRVLALDDGNAQVLALVARARRGSRATGMLTIVGASLALVGLVAGVGALRMRFGVGPRRVDSAPPEAEVARLDAASSPVDANAAPIDAQISRDALVALEAPLDASVARDVRRADAAPLDAASDARPSPRLPATPLRVSVPSSGSREVRFAPTPTSVQISIDGAAPREFGPDFYTVTLSVGRHRIAYASPPGSELHLYPSSFVVDVPEGDERLVLAHRIPFRAGLKVVCLGGGRSVQGHYRIGALAQRFACGVVERIPIEAQSVELPIVVEAEGFSSYRRDRLPLNSAETLQTYSVELSPSAPSP